MQRKDSVLKHASVFGPLRQPPSHLAPEVRPLDPTHEEPLRTERRIALVRLLILLALLPLLWGDVIVAASETVLVGLTVLITGYALGTMLLLPRLRRAPREDVFLTIDILAATALVVLTGGVESTLLFLLYLPMLVAALRLDLRRTVLSALAVSAIVVWMWSVAEGGLPSLGSSAVRVGLFSLGGFLLALFFGTLAHETRLSITRHRSNIELSRAYESTLEGWSRALDMRDNETEGHTQRVTELTIHLARIMGLSDADLVHVQRGALLHDIGKLAIPDSIMFKPGALTDDQVATIRRHPDYAYALLSPIAYLHPALDIPYCHHEKWDGTGYPRGLKGKEIPLAARIFAVVDVWDALRSNRPYRPAWPDRKAKDYIREQAGKHFDPQVVKVFLQMLESLERPSEVRLVSRQPETRSKTSPGASVTRY